jgi:coproporphyrinogen III oxidase-like Fe-S oxidoreductase
MTYKKGPKYRERPVQDIVEDMETARQTYGDHIRTIFFPAGNTIAMPTDSLADICCHAYRLFPFLERVTVYGSSQYIRDKGLQDLAILKKAGLSRIHVGLESGDDEVLRRIKKGSVAQEQIEAGQMLKQVGIEVNLYVMLGIGGKDRTTEHALGSADAINAIEPDCVRLRTFVPKINTLLLYQIQQGQFELLTAHGVLQETRLFLEHVQVDVPLKSDHYTNYIQLEGKTLRDKTLLLETIDQALQWPESHFRSLFVGTQ